MITDRFLTFTINSHPLLAFLSVALLSLLPYFIYRYFTFCFSVPLQDIREALGEERTCHVFPFWLFPLFGPDGEFHSNPKWHRKQRCLIDLVLAYWEPYWESGPFVHNCGNTKQDILSNMYFPVYEMHLKQLIDASYTICILLYVLAVFQNLSILITSILDRSGTFC